jgi:isopentenyl-diphosphate Delta-isomerase
VEGQSDTRTKDLHLQVCLEYDVESSRATGLEEVGLEGDVPDFALADMDLSYSFLGKLLSLPLLVAPITGGGSQSTRINRTLAEAAELCGIGMAVGSERPMLEKRVGAESYLIRELAPTIPLLGNLGLIHVKRGKDYLLEAVESIDADGITIYVNPLHEVLQEHGEKDFRGCLEMLGAIADDFPYPIFLKEVGFGLSRSVVEWASRHRMAGVDVAGVGGTSWVRIEGFLQGRDYSVFENLGTCTRDAVSAAQGNLREDQYLIASGGVRTGVDVAKCFALGANLVSMGLPFFQWANKSREDVLRSVERLTDELKVCLWYCGCPTPAHMKGKYTQLTP